MCPRQQLQQGLGRSVPRLSAPPLPIRVARDGDGGRTVGVGDNRQAFAIGEVERVERLSQPALDAAHPPVR